MISSAPVTRTGVGLASVPRLRSFGDAPALFADGRWTSYADLARRVDDAGRRLGGNKLLVAVPEGRTLDHVVWILAALGGGHTLLLHDAGREDQILRTYPPHARLVPGRRGLRLRHHRSEVDLHPELALLLSTSGTTGSPKLVRLGAAGIDANAAAIAEYLALQSDDRAVSSLPLAYSYGLSVLTSHLSVGAGVVLSDLSVVDPCFWELARDTGVTTVAGVPHTFEMLERIRFDGRQTLGSLRRLTQAGGRMSADRVMRFAELAQAQGWDLHVMYGQTEATARIAHLPPELAVDHPDCVGVAIPGGALRIDAGELVYQGPNVMLGYATSAADLGRGRDIEELRTGDRAEFTDEGLVRIVGRNANEAKVFGLRIDLDHVESRVPGVVVVAHDDELVVLAASDRTSDVQRLTGLPPCAVRWVPVAEVPLLGNGKVDRPAVRRLAQPGADPQPDGKDLTDRVCAALGAALKKDRVTPRDSFVSLGGDSLAYVAASVRLERLLGPLPLGWHTMVVADLVAGHEPVSRRRWWAVMETAVLLRAVAVLLIVASHTVVIDVRGGAHLLLGLAGYNYARFVLPVEPGRLRIVQGLRGIALFAVPALLWLAVVIAFSGEYGMSVFGVTFSDLPGDHPAWRYWFLEVLLLVLVIAVAVTAPRALARLERRAPVAFALGLVAGAVLAREALFDPAAPRPLFTLAASAWVFFLGWLIAVLTQRGGIWPATGLVLLLVLPFFSGAARDVVVAGGLLLLIWVPRLRVPRLLATVLTAVAAASLTIYLTHWQVYPPFDQWPVVAAAVALAGGIAIHAGLRRIGLTR